MGIFDNMLKSDESLFKNPDALDPAFIPKVIPYREEQQRQIAGAIQPLFSERNGKSVVLYGLPGVGKTVACKKVLSELEEKEENIIQIYVNCWEKNTSYKVAIAICEQLGNIFTLNKKTDELYRDIVKIINKKKAVFVFDEIDRAEDHDFLYTLTEEVYKKSIIMITNLKDFMVEMDERLKSRIMPTMVEFKPYNLAESKEILKTRVEYAFYPGVLETEAFDIIASKAATLQDMRAGILMLKDIGELAESKAKRKITTDIAQQVVAKVDDFKGAAKEKEGIESMILEIVKNNPKSKIGDLYKMFIAAGGNCSYKTYQRKISALQKSGYLDLTKRSGEGGNTTIIEAKKPKTLNDF